MADVDTNREIALAVVLALVQEITTEKADAPEDPDLDQAAPVATLLAMAEDIIREAILLRETRVKEEVLAAAELLRTASALVATLAATAGETLAHLLIPRAPATTEDPSHLEKQSLSVPLQRSTRAHLRLPLSITKLMLKSKLTEYLL